MSHTLSKPKLGAIAPWAGSKRNIAPAIVEEIGPHRSYWEPFCGSLAPLMAKPRVPCETVNDLHGDLINLARVLKVEDLAVDLYGRLARFVLHEDLFHEAADRFKQRGHLVAEESPDVDRAEDFMVCSWYGRNGVAGTQSYNQGFCVRYTANGGHAATRWQSAVESIPAWHSRLAHVTILNRDAFDLLPRIDDVETTAIYVDPPYLAKGFRYVYDFEDADHQRLAEALRKFSRARIVISYYDDPRLADLYPGWKQRRLDVNKAMAAPSNRDGHNKARATEVLLVNERQRGLFA